MWEVVTVMSAYQMGVAVTPLLDFGVFSASELGIDETNRPKALGVETITLTNGGTSEVSVTVELADDGIPENAGEAVR